MQLFSTAEEMVDNAIKSIGTKIVLAVPLGAGKPNTFINAFYNRATRDPEIHLTILTALTLTKPHGKSLLESRFIEPFADRVFGDYPNLQYDIDRARTELPKNIEIIEFYFPAGQQISNRNAQCNYTSSNYTHVARDLYDRGVNVIAHLVAPDKTEENYSLSCNADVTTDIIDMLNNSKKSYIFCAQVNHNLPFMYGDAVIPREQFDLVLQHKDLHYPIFAPPKLSVPEKDHLIGMYASTLIKDDGELQVGIGSLGDALVYSLLLRHSENETYQEILRSLSVRDRYSELIEQKGDTQPFNKGLFGATEMFVDGFMHLIKAGILKRKVYDHVILQRLFNENLITEDVLPETLHLLLERRAIHPKLTYPEFNFLKEFGIFRPDVEFKDCYIICASGKKIEADFNKDSNFQEILKNCLGSKITNGAIVHAGFFLGCNDFYQWLRELPETSRRLIHMKPVTKINQLYGHEVIDRLHRKRARFVNTCLKMTLFGAAVSDGLDDGRVISGVGGQYNFVAMAQALPDGHSIIQLRSTRFENGVAKSNIVFNYGHITIPRHLRDIVITEYGIADIRGKTDSEVAAALIEIADSRFQNDLIQQAKKAGKLKSDYTLPSNAKNNKELELSNKIRPLITKGLFPKFPFGTELTEIEIKLGGALKSLKKKRENRLAFLKLVLGALFTFKIDKKFDPHLERMRLLKPESFQEKLYQKILVQELSKLI